LRQESKAARLIALAAFSLVMLTGMGAGVVADPLVTQQVLQVEHVTIVSTKIIRGQSRPRLKPPFRGSIRRSPRLWRMAMKRAPGSWSGAPRFSFSRSAITARSCKSPAGGATHCNTKSAIR
jgi:hypothetical protein